MARKPLLIILLTAVMVLFGASQAMAGVTFSESWYQTSDGVWHVYGKDGDTLKNCWFCDDAVAANGRNVWYLIDEHGNMASGALVQDGTGNYYSLETSHDGYYGMLRYKSGNYDGISLTFNQNHDGSFGAITNADGIEALKAKYGVKTVSIDNSNIYYSSELLSKSGTSASTSGTTVSGPGSVKNGANSDGTYTYNGKTYVSDYSWGNHYLTGYSGGGRTRSGTTCTANRTLSGPYAMLGKVCYIRAVSGPSSADIHKYDGIYVFEDTGGAAVETGTDNTMNVPVADVYFDTYEEAVETSKYGWITVEVIILKEK